MYIQRGILDRRDMPNAKRQLGVAAWGRFLKRGSGASPSREPIVSPLSYPNVLGNVIFCFF